MEALKLTQVGTGTEVLQFPNTKEIEIAPFVNERNELLTRNRKAQAYSNSCVNKKINKRKEMVTEVVSAIFLIGSLSFFWLQLFI